MSFLSRLEDNTAILVSFLSRLEDDTAKEGFETWRPSPVQHLDLGVLQALQDRGKLSVIVKGGTPAKNPCQVVACPKGQHPHLALKNKADTRMEGSLEV